MLKAKTLISYYILLEKAMNMKIDGFICGCVVLVLAVFSLDSKIV